MKISKNIVCRLIDSSILESMSIAQFIDATASNDMEVQFFSIDKNKNVIYFRTSKSKVRDVFRNYFDISKNSQRI